MLSAYSSVGANHYPVFRWCPVQVDFAKFSCSPQNSIKPKKWTTEKVYLINFLTLPLVVLMDTYLAEAYGKVQVKGTDSPRVWGS